MKHFFNNTLYIQTAAITFLLRLPPIMSKIKDHLCNKCIYVLELIVPVSARKVKAFPLLNSVQ